MIKVALLIGVSQHEPGLTALPSAVGNVTAMQRVLQHPEMGGFEPVKTLINPTPMAMQDAIETLFSNLAEDDLALLFFSGHGLKDENGRLYFATRYTRKDSTGGLLRATAFPASFIQEIMNKSRCNQQVMVLDCGFNMTCADNVTVKTDNFVDVEAQLGGKRRVILTASTSTQDTLEQEGEELSVYTRYLVEGIETGTADSDNDGAIAIDELHDYARQRVQEMSPAMQPKIFAEQIRAKIILAKALVNDPKLRYRKEVERFANRGKISDNGRQVLDALRNELDLAPEQTAVIEAEVLNPYQKYQKKLERYGRVFLEAVRREGKVSSDTRNELQRFQQSLQLRNEDTTRVEGFIERKFFPNPLPSHSPSASISNLQPPPPPPSFLSSNAANVSNASAADSASQQTPPSDLPPSPFASEFGQVEAQTLSDQPFRDLTDELEARPKSDLVSFDLDREEDASSLYDQVFDDFEDLANLPESDLLSFDLDDEIETPSLSDQLSDDLDDLAELPESDLDFLALDLDEDGANPPSLPAQLSDNSNDPLARLPESDLLSLDLDEDSSTASNLSAPLLDDLDNLEKLPESEPISFELNEDEIAGPSLSDDLVDELEAPSRPEPISSELNAAATAGPSLSDQLSNDLKDELTVSTGANQPLFESDSVESVDQSSTGMGLKWIVPTAIALCAIVAVVIGFRAFRVAKTEPRSPVATSSEPSDTTPESSAATPSGQPTTPSEAQPAAISPAASATLYRQALVRGNKAATLAQSAQSQEDWQQVTNEWGQAIELLDDTPQSDSDAYNKALQKVAEYQQYQAIAQQRVEHASWQQAVRIAETAGQQAGLAQTAEDWNQVTAFWGDAIALLKTIPEDYSNYETAQAKIVEYQRNMEIAKQRALRN